jgi:homoserine dehydrogenase
MYLLHVAHPGPEESPVSAALHPGASAPRSDRPAFPAAFAAPGESVSRIDLVLVGARGQVGSALRRQLDRRRAWLREHTGVDYTLVAAFDRRGFAHDLQGLQLENFEHDLQPRRDNDLELLLARLTRPGAAPAVFIDCTASDEVADWYPRLLSGGVGVVGANKRANARSLSHFHELQRLARRHGAPYRYETTVGAAIPVLGPIRDVRLRGETIRSLQGVLSGSLSHILHRLHEGCAFSDAVAEAGALGLTEPDPFEDLRAQDLARKLLVLGREAGFALELDAVRIESLVEEVDGVDNASENLCARLRAQDARWRARVTSALDRGERLVMVAQVDSAGGRVGIQSLPESSPFAQLKPGENLVLVHTDLQSATPLALGGKGAGAEITAAGVFSDIVAAANQLLRR